MDVDRIILGSLAYCAALVVVAYGWAQYLVRVRRCWWLPLPPSCIGFGVFAAWRYVFGMTMESELLEVAQIGLYGSLTIFLVLSAIGWWHWGKHRLARRATTAICPGDPTAVPAATSPAPPRSAD